MRIDTNLAEEDSDAAKELADRKGLQKTETYTRAIRTGVQVEKRRECIKELIVRFMQDEHDRYKDRGIGSAVRHRRDGARGRRPECGSDDLAFHYGNVDEDAPNYVRRLRSRIRLA